MTAEVDLRRARDRQRGLGPRRRRLRRARRRPGRGRDQGLAAGEQLLEGAGRDPGRVRRRGLARAARRGRLALLARDGRPRARRGADRRGARTRSTGSRSSGSSSPRENGGYRLARCGGASQKRLLQVGDRTGHAITKGLREAWEGGSGHLVRERAAPQRSSRCANGWRAVCGEHTIDAGDGRARGRRPLLRRGAGARRALDEPSERDRRGDADGARPRRRVARPRRAPVPPERRRLAREHAGLLDPRDDARLRRGAPERRGRGVHRLARPARRRLAGDRRRGRGRARRRDARRAAGGLPRHDAHLRGRRRRSRCRTCCAATAPPASIRSPRGSSPTPSSTTRTAGS